MTIKEKGMYETDVEQCWSRHGIMRERHARNTLYIVHVAILRRLNPDYIRMEIPDDTVCLIWYPGIVNQSSRSCYIGLKGVNKKHTIFYYGLYDCLAQELHFCYFSALPPSCPWIIRQNSLKSNLWEVENIVNIGSN